MDALDKLLLLPSPPRHSVLSICRSLGHIPSSHRGRVYKILLNVSPLPLAASLETKIKRAEATSPPTADSTTTTPPPPTPRQVSSPELTSRLSIDDYDDDNDESVSESINSDNSENSSIEDLEAERELEKQSKGSFQVEGKWAKSPLVEEPKKLVNQRVVKADAERTRGSHPQIERLLTHFCHSNDLKYKQGLNELLAPFLTLDYTSSSDSEFQPPYSTEKGEREKNVFNELVGYGCFEEFLKKFLPTNVYADDGFAALQCCFRIFRLLLLYHDPNLCKLLDGHRLPPELYASGWFLTLFSQRLDMESLWKWWDLYVLYDEPHLHHFICLRLLMRGAEEINEAGEASLPVVLQQLSMQVESIDPVKLLQEARMVSDETPRSFTSLLDRACWGGNYINEKVRRFEKQSLKLVLKSVGAWSCVPISADEGIGFALKDWGIIEPNYIDKNGRTPPRFRNRSRGSSAESRDKLFSGTDEDKTADKPPKPFQDLPSYLTSPTGSHTSYESDMDSMASEFSESEVEDDFSDEEGEGGEENDEDAPTSPVKVKGGGEGASVGVPLPTTPNTLKQSKIIHQRKSSKKKYVLLDCRPKSEFDDCHVYGSIHLDDECWNTGEVASVVEGFKEMKDCHFALIGSGPSSFDLQMSVNAHKTGPSKSWKRKQRLKNASGDVVEKSGGFLKKMAAAMTTKKENDPNKFVPRGGGDEEDDLDPEHMQVGALEEDIAVSRWVCMFLQLDFAHVSYVRGGIKAIVRELKKAGKENGVGLAEGAEATLEGNKVGKSEVDEAMSASGRAIEKMMKNMVGDLSPTVAWMPGDDDEEEEEEGGGEGGGKGEDEVGAEPQGKKPPAEKDQRKSRRSLEGVGKGWNSFVSNASKAFERRSSKEGSEFGGGGGKSNSNSPKNSGGSGGMFGGRMFGGGDKSVGEKSGEGGQKISNDSSRSSELDLIRSELEGNLAEGAQHPSDKAAPMWVRKLSVQMEKAGTGFLMASQKLGEKSREVGNDLVEKTKAVAKARSSPRTSLSGLMGRKKAAGYYIGKIVDIGDWIGSVAGNGGSACTFSAMKCPTDDSMWTEEAMTPCQLLIGDGFFLALELNSGTPGAGPIIACHGLLSLNKITTKQNLHGLTVFWFKLGDGEVGEGEETEIQLPFVVEGHRDCIEKVKIGFKVEKKKEKERLKELERVRLRRESGEEELDFCERFSGEEGGGGEDGGGVGGGGRGGEEE